MQSKAQSKESGKRQLCQHPDAEKLWERAQKYREAEVNAFLIKKECHDVYDAKFLVGEEKISVSASRCALAFISPVFHAMFFGQMEESDRDTLISIPDIDPEALQCIVRFSNGVNPGITDDNCVKVKYLTEKYQIKSLDQELDSFIIGCLNEVNFCTIFCEVHNTHISSLVEKCLRKLEDFRDIRVLLASKGFLSLNVDQMKLLVSSEYFVVLEETIWRHCVMWAKHKSESEANCESSENIQAFYLKQIKSEIRFTLMNTKFILEEIHPENVLTESEIIAVLSDIICPSSLMKSNFCCKVRSSLQPASSRSSLQPASYFVYGAGSDIVNGQYEYNGHYCSNYIDKITLYTRVASNGKKLGLYQIHYRYSKKHSGVWWISEYSGHITNESADAILHCTEKDYYCSERNKPHPDKCTWKKCVGDEVGEPPVPTIRALGRCFPLPTITETP